MKVLIIEDDPNLASLVGFIFQSRKVPTVTVTHDFDCIWEDIDWTEIDAVVCDQMLGDGFDGRQILKRICEEHPSVVRILFTANIDAEEQATYADHVLHKPTESLVMLELLGLNE